MTTLPILIIPGFMSSGLQVVETNIKQEWVGKRIWLNLTALGFEAAQLRWNGTTETNHYYSTAAKPTIGDKVATTTTTTATANATTGGNHTGETNIIHVEESNEVANSLENEENKSTIRGERLRNAWVHHMALDHSDMVSEREGIKVRAIEGLAGVDYLAPGLLTSHVTYVFGPMIRALFKVGYNNGVTTNLDAAPYDWRLPPSVLESRDAYFTRTLDQIEKLYNDNQQTPVVLVCHSMGCKVGHYLLNFAKETRGQDWIDRYIHTYCPIAAPHLGAPTALRSLVSGNRMGLDTFLSSEETLVMGRSLGCSAWLLPTQLPPTATPSAFVRNDGAFELRVLGGIDASVFLQNREERQRPKKFNLTVTYMGAELSTPFTQIDEEDQRVYFNEAFTFRTMRQGLGVSRVMKIYLCEPGINNARKSATRRTRNRFRDFVVGSGEEAETSRQVNDSRLRRVLIYLSFWWLISPLIRSILKFCFDVVHSIIWCCFCQGPVRSVDRISRKKGGTSILAMATIRSARNDVFGVDKANVDKINNFKRSVIGKRPSNIEKVSEVEIDVDLISYLDLRRYCCSFHDKRKTTIKVMLKWIPPPGSVRLKASQTTRPIICQPSAQPSQRELVQGMLRRSQAKRTSLYSAINGTDLLEAEGVSQIFDNIENVYDNDPFDPRGLSSFAPPPVRLVKAIYGINIPTEVGAVFRRKSVSVASDQRLCHSFELDQECSWSDLMVDSDTGAMGDHFERSGMEEDDSCDNKYVVKHGILLETETTHQKSGDGTVPYWSLSHVKSWEKDCQLQVHELPKAEHREILADKRVQQILIDYCCSTNSVEVGSGERFYQMGDAGDSV